MIYTYIKGLFVSFAGTMNLEFKIIYFPTVSKVRSSKIGRARVVNHRGPDELDRAGAAFCCTITIILKDFGSLSMIHMIQVKFMTNFVILTYGPFKAHTPCNSFGFACVLFFLTKARFYI